MDWKIRYCTVVDPEDDGAVVTLGGGRILGADGKSLFHDVCLWCEAEIPNDCNEPRERCFDSGNVLCWGCVGLRARFSLRAPRHCLVESEHPLLKRLRIALNKGLKRCVEDCFKE